MHLVSDPSHRPATDPVLEARCSSSPRCPRPRTTPDRARAGIAACAWCSPGADSRYPGLAFVSSGRQTEVREVEEKSRRGTTEKIRADVARAVLRQA